MARNVVVDTGPLVALLSAGDAWHEWTLEHFSQLEPPLLTCEPVLGEAAFIVKRTGGNPSAVLALLDKGVLRIVFSMQDQAGHLRALMDRYSKVPMSVADACLVRMSELINDSVVMTVDSDFRIYKKSNRKVIPLIAPEEI